MAEIIRKTTGAISTIVGSLMIFHAVADSYQGKLAVITNLVNLVQHLPELVIGTILVITGYLLYPTEYEKELLEDTFHFDEGRNLQ
tara:strand:+ start:132 stop:389 length:258 start_codon:yes stop_codon:yes gene_type:complete